MFFFFNRNGRTLDAINKENPRLIFGQRPSRKKHCTNKKEKEKERNTETRRETDGSQIKIQIEEAFQEFGMDKRIPRDLL